MRYSKKIQVLSSQQIVNLNFPDKQGIKEFLTPFLKSLSQSLDLFVKREQAHEKSSGEGGLKVRLKEDAENVGLVALDNLKNHIDERIEDFKTLFDGEMLRLYHETVRAHPLSKKVINPPYARILRSCKKIDDLYREEQRRSARDEDTDAVENAIDLAEKKLEHLIKQSADPELQNLKQEDTDVIIEYCRKKLNEDDED